jgi:hypothetical protein
VELVKAAQAKVSPTSLAVRGGVTSRFTARAPDSNLDAA